MALGLAACGGMEPGAEENAAGLENAAAIQSESSELTGTCESLSGTFCSPRPLERPCYWSDGAEGYCYCQDPPFNKWLCDYVG
ncbi:hypothetical protein [Myxococcus sp. Y35]|uniref:hypothetical protein n=1 Tax=Pseudomyxococcus flavus TaxID=3115648 RepID=UPI003CF65D06